MVADLDDYLDSVCILPTVPLGKAISQLDEAATGALAVCGENGHLRAVLTDGDIRRAILQHISLDVPVEEVATLEPVVARGEISATEALRLMIEHDINHLPVVADDGTLLDFILRRDLVPEMDGTLSAVIMAGGYGTRLLPLTEDVPKPMLPVGNRPLLERMVEQLEKSGIREVNLTTHYLSDAIVEHFGDGEEFGVQMTYSREGEPLGTAGGLTLFERPKGPSLVINGDILTGVSYPQMLAYHRKHRALLTMGIRVHALEVPFGVVECDGERVTELREKPSLTFFINAGVYLLEPAAYDYIPQGTRFDMTDLIKALLNDGQAVVSFPIYEYWQDVGRHSDYEQVQVDISHGRI